MLTTDRVELALRIIAEGKPYTRVDVREGDVESGPYALKYRGYRMGRLILEVAPNGDTYIMAESKRRGREDYWGAPAVWLPIPSPYGEVRLTENAGKPISMRTGPGTIKHHDFRVKRIHRALGWSDAHTLLKATRAVRKANRRRLTPDHHCECI